MRVAPSSNRPVLLYAAVVALAIAASATGIANEFALDDVAIIAGNQRVQTLDRWWRLFATSYWPPDQGQSLYRPVITLGFALQWKLGGGSPLPYHVVSVALYAVACGLVLALFRQLIESSAASFAAASLFAVHPVHVEAVGNIVGQAELVAAVATLAGSVIYMKARQRVRPGAGAVSAIAALYALACLAKEHALLFPAILLLLELFAVGATETRRAMGTRMRELAPLFTVLASIAIVYLTARTLVLGELLGEKHLVPTDGGGRIWVMLAVVPHWIRLLFWPARLSAEYSPQHIELPSTPDASIVPGLLAMIALAILYRALGTGQWAESRDWRTGRLAIALGALTLLPVSNLFSVMVIAERTLFLPSVAAMLAVGAVVSSAGRRVNPPLARAARPVAIVAAIALVSIGVWRSAERQRVWRDNDALFSQMVVDAPKSYRAQYFYGQLLFDRGQRAEGERYLKRSIELNPTPSDVSPLNYLATQYRMSGMCGPALPLYERALAGNAARPDVRYGLAACLLELGRVADARRLAEEGVRRGDLRSLFQALIARTDSASRRG